MSVLFERFKQWVRVINMIPCECGSRDDHWIVKDSINGIPCEADIICDDCNKAVNYLAYGSCQYPETYTALISKTLRDINFRVRQQLGVRA